MLGWPDQATNYVVESETITLFARQGNRYLVDDLVNDSLANRIKKEEFRVERKGYLYRLVIC